MLSCSVVSDSVTPWTLAYQAPLSMEFFGKNIRVGCHFFLQGIFQIQGSNPHLLCLLHCRHIVYPLSHQGSLLISLPLLKLFGPLGGLLKQKHHFATKGQIVKAMVLPVVMYQCESWTIKKTEPWRNWCFQTVMLEKTLESPLDSKEIKPVNPKGN